MFREYAPNIIGMVQFELWELSPLQMIIKDQKDPEGKYFCDVVPLPCEYIADDQERKIECVLNHDTKWLQVRSMNMNPEDDYHFFRAGVEMDSNNDSLMFGFEKDGSLYDSIIGRYHNQDMCYFRKMDIVGDHTIMVSSEYRDGILSVSRRDNKEIDEITLTPTSKKKGKISFTKNHELLEEVEVSGNLSTYYSSLLSTINDAIVQENELLQKMSPELFQKMRTNIPVFEKFLEYLSESYDTDYVDSFLQKHQLFQTNEKYVK